MYRNENVKIRVDAAITSGQLHSNGSKLCVATANKMVFVYDTNDGKLLLKSKLEKKVISVTFAGDVLLLGDKTGNVYVLKGNEDLELVLGHTASSILCMLYDSKNKLLLTGDREEKIRVSRFPTLSIIERFCFGHKSAITAMCSISDDSIVSSSKDGSIIIWNHLQGRALQRFDLDKDTFVSKLAYSPSTGILAALTNVKVLRMYYKTKSGEFKLSNTIDLSFDCMDLVFIPITNFLLAVPLAPDSVRLYSVFIQDDRVKTEPDDSSKLFQSLSQGWKCIEGSNAAEALSVRKVVEKTCVDSARTKRVMDELRRKSTKRRKIQRDDE